MNEFIEKLIDRLEEINHTDYGSIGSYESHVAVRDCLRDVKNIVNQLAEEFATEKNVGHNDQDLMIVESLPSLYPMMQPFEEEAVYRVVERAKYNNGWTPCSKELPPQPKSNLLFEK